MDELTGTTITNLPEKKKMRGYVRKFDGLTIKEKSELELLWINNFDEVKTYDELYPDNDKEDRYKRKYWSVNNYRYKRTYIDAFINGLIEAKFKNKFFVKENMCLQTLELHRKALNDGKDSIAADYWKVLLKQLGLIQDKNINIANVMPDVIRIVEHNDNPDVKIEKKE